jgi:membrane dipeptidase
VTDRAPETVHSKSIVIDAVCPLVMDNSGYLELYRHGGVTAIGPTVGGWEDARITLNRLGRWSHLLSVRDDVVLVRRAIDVENAKKTGRLGVFLHLQGTDPIEDNLDLIDLYKALGVGVIQLTYNVRNRVGDGCEERTDAGLSRFGIEVVERLNQSCVVVDCSHTGERTTIEAIEHSTAPVILSHSNVASVHSSPRNVSYELIEAIAKCGGIIGVAGFPGMLSKTTAPTLDDFIAHIDAIAERVGTDYVALGIDYYWGQSGIASDEEALVSYRQAVQSGRWSTAYPAPPHRYPVGIETPRTLPALTDRLLERGYTEVDVRKILGQNWLRVMRSVWG